MSKDASLPFDEELVWIQCPFCIKHLQHVKYTERSEENGVVTLSYSYRCPLCKRRWRGNTVRAKVEPAE